MPSLDRKLGPGIWAYFTVAPQTSAADVVEFFYERGIQIAEENVGFFPHHDPARGSIGICVSFHPQVFADLLNWAIDGKQLHDRHITATPIRKFAR